MKATGMVRRIDTLGRIVIPMEIRRTLGIRESDPLEIFTGENGMIMLKKFTDVNSCAVCHTGEDLITVDGASLCRKHAQAFIDASRVVHP